MSNIHFYVLEIASGQKSLYFACQLIEKMYTEDKHVYVHAQTQEEAERFDALLWTYRDDSFVPHNLYQQADDFSPPIQIGVNAPPTHHQDTLINLSRDIPRFFKQFKQVIEIVFLDAVVQQLGRERYKQYREQNCEITTHKLKANAI